MAHRSRTLRVCAGCLCAIACLLLLKAQDSFAQRPVAQLYMSSASGVDLVQHQVTLPAYIGSTSDGATVYYIVTEASTPAAARLWGVNAAPSLSGLRGSSQVQRVRQQATPDNSDVVFNATVDFEYGRRRVVPGPAGKEFPPMAFNYSAMADPGETGTCNPCPVCCRLCSSTLVGVCLTLCSLYGASTLEHAVAAAAGQWHMCMHTELIRHHQVSACDSLPSNGVHPSSGVVSPVQWGCYWCPTEHDGLQGRC
jgi:hypothetical protein